MAKNEIYGVMRGVELNPASGQSATIKIFVSANFGATIKINDEGSMDDLQKKYDFIKLKNGSYEIDDIDGCMCTINKNGDKYTLMQVYRDEDEELDDEEI